MKKKIGIVIAVLVLAAAEAWFFHWMYQTAAIDKMREAAVHELSTMVSLDAYGPKQQEKIKVILRESEAQVMEATDERTVAQIEKNAAEEIGKIKTLKQLRKKWYASLKKSVKLDDYRPEEQREVRKVLQSAKKDIYQCVKKSETKPIIKRAEDKIAGVKTDAQLTAEEEAARQAELARQRAAAAARAKAKSRSRHRSSKKRSGSGGCVGNDAKNFY